MSSANLEATSVTAIAENASSDNYGLYNYGAAAATLNGGSFTGRGGTNACCIRNRRLSTARLEATAVAALGEEGASNNCGFCNASNARATIYGGSFTALGTGSSSAYGLMSEEGTAMSPRASITSTPSPPNPSRPWWKVPPQTMASIMPAPTPPT
jgi:hypothetical protein